MGKSLLLKYYRCYLNSSLDELSENDLLYEIKKHYPILVIPNVKNLYMTVVTKEETTNVTTGAIIVKTILNIEYLEELVKNGEKIPERMLLFRLLRDKNELINNKNLKYDSMKELKNNCLNAVDYCKSSTYEVSNITQKLFNYQKENIKWMANIENSNLSFTFHHEKYLKVGSLLIDLHNEQFYLETDKITQNIKLRGGVLCDEMGLGKTICSIGLHINNPVSFDDKLNKNGFLNVKATLVICPNQVCDVWFNEIKKYTNPQLNVILITKKKDFEKCTYNDIINSDFVIVSFNFITTNPVFSQYWKEYQTYCQPMITCFETIKMENLRRKNLYNEHYPFISLFNWGRIIVDEFHEILSNPRKEILLDFTKYLSSEYFWCISATPFSYKSISYGQDTSVSIRLSFEHIFDFIKDKSHNYSEYNFGLINDISKKIFRRNTKISVESEKKLPNIITKNILLDFSTDEQILYDTHKLDSSITKEQLIQLCCHPKICNELKTVIVKCKNIDEIKHVLLKQLKLNISMLKKKIKYY